MDLYDRSHCHLLIGGHLVLGGVYKVSEVMKCSFILSLERQAVVQAATSGAHHSHQLLICILHTAVKMPGIKKYSARNL